MIDRLKQVIMKIFGTQSNFSEQLGLSKQVVTEYVQGRSFLKINKLVQLSEDFHIDLNWLLTGKGNMLLTEQDNISEQQKIDELSAKVQKLEIENALLKELIKK